jgi:hypothetical protein
MAIRTATEGFWSFADYAVTYGGPSLVMTAVMVLGMPALYLLVVRRLVRPWWQRIAVLLVVWFTAYAFSYGDVLRNAMEAQRLCEQEGGLKVYGTAEVEGFLAEVDLKPWAPAGFRYIEHVYSGQTRSEMVNGKEVLTRVDPLISTYEMVKKTERLAGPFTKISLRMRHRETKELLGELNIYELYPGKVDRWFSKKLGGGLPPLCVGRQIGRMSDFPFIEDPLIAATLRAPGHPPPALPNHLAH